MFGRVSQYGFFHEFQDRDEVKPKMSVCLSNTQFCVPHNGHESGHIFEITSPYFGALWLSVKERTYRFRVEDYEDFTLWVKELTRFSKSVTAPNLSLNYQ